MQNYLSLSTTPSMQAPNRITQDISREEKLRNTTWLRIFVYIFIILWHMLIFLSFLPMFDQLRIHTVEVVVMAAMVPIGMDFWASRRSPERFEPAMIPVSPRKKKIHLEIHS